MFAPNLSLSPCPQKTMAEPLTDYHHSLARLDNDPHDAAHRLLASAMEQEKQNPLMRRQQQGLSP